MRTWRKALREVRMRRAEIQLQQFRVACALRVLEQQYRVAPVVPLGVAATGGLLLGYSRRRLPRGVVTTLWRWSMLLVRGLL